MPVGGFLWAKGKKFIAPHLWCSNPNRYANTYCLQAQPPVLQFACAAGVIAFNSMVQREQRATSAAGAVAPDLKKATAKQLVHGLSDHSIQTLTHGHLSRYVASQSLPVRSHVRVFTRAL